MTEVLRPMTAPATLHLRQVSSYDAVLLHKMYSDSPGYFDIISAPMPALADVASEIKSALQDRRRAVVFVCSDDGVPLAYLDYKRDYPQNGEATINLLLVPEQQQSQGLGSRIVPLLEANLRHQGMRRVLASVYGNNHRAVDFWQRLGFSEAQDARPIVVWYAKTLAPTALAAAALPSNQHDDLVDQLERAVLR
jgi:ribosomal protein S18 acetylase RimI-like enzyme